MIELRTITAAEYIGGLKEELRIKGFRQSVKDRCDEINDVCSCMGYVNHRYVQELLCEIMDLIDWRAG